MQRMRRNGHFISPSSYILFSYSYIPSPNLSIHIFLSPTSHSSSHFSFVFIVPSLLTNSSSSAFLPSTEPLLLPPLHFLILHAPTSSTEIFMRCLAERGFVVGFTDTSWLSKRNRHADTQRDRQTLR